MAASLGSCALNEETRGCAASLAVRSCSFGIGIIKETSVAKTFTLEETTIDEIHAAYTGKALTCVELVQSYLDRIAAYDQKGPALNSYVTINPAALTEAAALDAAFSKS